MARIKLDIPEELPFRCALTVRVTDLNYGNHLGNDAILGLIHEARVRWLAHLGVSEADLEGGIGLIQADVAIQFKAEGFLGDRIEAAVGAVDIGPRSWDFVYRLTLPERDQVLALAKTGMVAFDYAQRRVAEIPEPFRRQIAI